MSTGTGVITSSHVLENILLEFDPENRRVSGLLDMMENCMSSIQNHLHELTEHIVDTSKNYSEQLSEHLRDKKQRKSITKSYLFGMVSMTKYYSVPKYDEDDISYAREKYKEFLIDMSKLHFKREDALDVVNASWRQSDSFRVLIERYAMLAVQPYEDTIRKLRMMYREIRDTRLGIKDVPNNIRKVIVGDYQHLIPQDKVKSMGLKGVSSFEADFIKVRDSFYELIKKENL